jgi:hypothetical protein
MMTVINPHEYDEPRWLAKGRPQPREKEASVGSLAKQLGKTLAIGSRTRDFPSFCKPSISIEIDYGFYRSHAHLVGFPRIGSASRPLPITL